MSNTEKAAATNTIRRLTVIIAMVFAMFQTFAQSGTITSEAATTFTTETVYEIRNDSIYIVMDARVAIRTIEIKWFGENHFQYENHKIIDVKDGVYFVRYGQFYENDGLRHLIAIDVESLHLTKHHYKLYIYHGEAGKAPAITIEFDR